MSLTTLYTLHGVKVGTAVIGGITDQRIARGAQQLIEATSGLARPTLSAVMAGRPVFGWTTTDLITALTAIPVTGKAIAASPNTAVLYWQSYVAGGARGVGSTHKLITVSLGMVVPRTLTVEQDRVATCSFEAFGASATGLVDPYVITAGALETGVTDSSKWTLGKAVVNGAALPGVASLSIDFGLAVKSDKAYDGDIYPSIVAVETIKPIIKIRTAELATGVAFGLATAQTSPSILYLRKIAAGGVRDADNLTTHISLTINQAAIYCDEVAGASGGEQMAEVTIVPSYNGTNEPIVIATGVAIA